MPHSLNWQDALEPPFVQRLLRPWLRPGRIDPRMTSAIFARYQPMTPLPLVDQLTRRQNRIAAQQSPSQPIVYAQPLSSPNAVTSQASSVPIARPQFSGQPTIIQAKFASSNRPATLPSASPSNLSSSTLVTNSVERSPQTTSPDLLSLPLIQSANPPAPESLSPLRPRRPRFERNVDRQFSNSGSDVGEQTASVPSPLSSSPTIPLPLVSTVAPDISISPAAQTLHPIVPDPQSTVLQNESTSQNIPLVIVGLTQLKEQENRPKLLVVRSPQRENAIASISPGDKRKSAPTRLGEEKASVPIKTLTATIEQPPKQTSSLPLVQVPNASGLPEQLAVPSKSAQPLVFSAPLTREIGESTASHSPINTKNLMSLGAADRGHSATDFEKATPTSQSVPVVSAQRQVPQQPAVDVDALADKVERKLMRRLVIERERRGRS